MKPSEFLELLWGKQPPGLIQLWRKHDKTSFYARAPIAGDMHTGAEDVYTCVGLAGKDHGKRSRARASQIVAIPGFWLDIDINGGPDQKTGAAPNHNAGRALARAVEQPTVLVHSGYGLQAWWLFDEPWRFASTAEQEQAALAAAQWNELHHRAARDKGWDVDSTHDLARLMRLPGTVNAKGDTVKPVKIAVHNTTRYPRPQLVAAAAAAGHVFVTLDPGRLTQNGNGAPGLKPADPGRVDLLKLDALITNSPEFARTWLHQRRGHAAGWSTSEYDLSIATQAAQAGFTDQELADLIAYHRRKWNGPDDAKATRLDYLAATVAKGRQAGGFNEDVEWFRQRGRERAEA